MTEDITLPTVPATSTKTVASVDTVALFANLILALTSEFWMPKKLAESLAVYAAGHTQMMTIEQCVAQIISADPAALDTVTIAPAGNRALSGRALCKITMQNILKAMTYRAHEIIARVALPATSDEYQDLVNAGILWYIDSRPQGVAYPDLRDFLLISCDGAAIKKYDMLCKDNVGAEETLKYLQTHSRYTIALRKAVSGWCAMHQLRQFLEANNQTVPLVDPKLAMNAETKLRIIDILFRGQGGVDGALLTLQM